MAPKPHVQYHEDLRQASNFWISSGGTMRSSETRCIRTPTITRPMRGDTLGAHYTRAAVNCTLQQVVLAQTARPTL
ncbi:hypothetical protein QC762_0003670 [Podospora pseudocomata]|uniref:Uncharacterized protein n=1 Tax=Podospora pseudocomata TaxID=2093779 RepID=A0ABR0GT44_9PEZI|nr:hypothetical protein QC762_0003670 [Podospora pseudocomata]